MKKLYVLAAVLFCLCLSTAAMAVNELVNGGFETGDFSGWTKTGAGNVFNSGDWSVLAYEGNRYAGAITNWGSNLSGEIVQWVDESMFPGWDPQGIGKVITVKGAALLHARHFNQTWENVWLQVGVLWESPTGPQEVLFTPMSNTGLGNNIAWVPFEYTYTVQGYQPQYVGLYLRWWNRDGMEWSYMFVDGLQLEGKCIPIPEPGSLLALGSGLIGLAGFAIRRRK